ncbi:hypothetical protein C8R45DRAFT_1209132 [Mycena sanguinolenta]|nr:hypothetical protein C8R45DRAFT_1209132 [Mycena sanguinolenta]
MSTSPTPTLSAHAARNPSKPIQQPRRRAHKSDAGSATQTVNDAKLKNEEMLAEVDAFQELRHEKVKELAIKYEKDEAFFLKLLTNGVQYSGARNTTLWNAFKHDLAKQAKENGDSKSTIELNAEAKEKYEEFKNNMTEDEKKELIAQLEDHRELQRKGVRATNKSASADAMQNATRIGQMKDLYERMGVRAFALFTRGNPDDPSLPHIEDSDEARLFFLEYLKLDILDVMRKFEHWSCTRDSGGPKENHKLSVIMKEISEMLNEGLPLALYFHLPATSLTTSAHMPRKKGQAKAQNLGNFALKHKGDKVQQSDEVQPRKRSRNTSPNDSSMVPKFHPELNFIEQCWGYAKRIYRMFPESSSEEDLERNMLAALDSVPLASIRRFAMQFGPTRNIGVIGLFLHDIVKI